MASVLFCFRDFMEGSMEKTTKMLAFLHPIIEEADPELREFLVRYVILVYFHIQAWKS